jgi:hypothetical protein
MIRILISIASTLSLAALAGAQVPAALDSTRCDSVVTAARVDSIPAALFLSVARLDGQLTEPRLEEISSTIGSLFTPPKPFRLTVFMGPARMRMLRPMGSDTATTLRAPTVTGVYRFVVGYEFGIRSLVTVRASLMPGFDSAAATAIREAVGMRGALTVPASDSSMTFELRLSTDSTTGARRIVSADFPRMPVSDAVARGTNPPPVFPEDEKDDGATAGEVVLRFVVDRTGIPELETPEVVRATSVSFLKAALTALPAQRFSPAMIRGCAVAQRVDYSFSFVLPADVGSPREPAKRPVRH